MHMEQDANCNNARGGYGGHIQASITVIPGQNLYVYVGGQSGFNGGTRNDFGNGGYGGGGTDIRSGASLLSRLVVAGGGGGGGYAE